MARTRILITVTTYPLPSRSYDELVCTAGVLEDGSWIRIYPVPFKFLEFKKWQWIELDIEPRKDTEDFRPESHRPVNVDLSDLEKIGFIDTTQNWFKRKEACLKKIFTNRDMLIQESKDPANMSLAVFKPSRILEFVVKDDDREWKESWRELQKQMDMLSDDSKSERRIIEKIPYKFKYKFSDDTGQISEMTIEDWEIFALYRNCLMQCNGDEDAAIEKVRDKYEREFIGNKDIYFFVGTTLAHHRARHNNPFTIIGVFYPKIDLQGDMFDL